MKKTLAITTLSALIFSGAAFAEDGGFYGAADIGQSTLGNPPGMNTSTGTAFRIGGGYKINENFAVEAGYTDFGSSDATLLGLSIAKITASGLGVAAVATLPLSEAFSLTGKVGVSSIKATATPSPLIAALGGITSSQTNNNANFGVGAKFAVSPSIALRAQYEDFGSVKTVANGANMKLSIISVGVTFGF